MDQIIITKADASTWSLFTKASNSAVTKAEQRRSLLGEDVINMTVESSVHLTFDIGDSITVFAHTYTLNALPREKKSGTYRYSYDLVWEGKQYDLLRAMFLDEDADGESIYADFSFTGTLADFMAVIINNLTRVYGTGKWLLGECPVTEVKTLTYADENCLAVLQDLCSEENFKMEFEITQNTGVFTIDIKTAVGQNLTHTYEYGRGKGLYDLTRQTISNKNIITRLYAFGAAKNLRSNYRGYSQRLKLPSIDLSYLEDVTAKAAFGLIEGVKTFEDIFPHRTGTITSLGSTIYKFIDSAMDFDLNAVDGGGDSLYLLAGTSAKIHFNTGGLAGYEFEVSAYDDTTKTFTIKKLTDERGQVFPDTATTAFQMAVGDEYVIIDITLPDTYITAAEAELLTAAQTYLTQNCQPRVEYALTFDELYLKGSVAEGTIVNLFACGDYIPISDTELNVNKSIRIKSFTRNVLRPYLYTLQLTDILETSILQRLLATTIDTQKIIALNKLNDVARARRNWKSTQELLDMVFDPDGYFDGTHIKPESIETLMLSVGTRSQQLTLNCKIEPNYQGNEQVVNISAGTLTHYAIAETIKDWTITASEVTLTETSTYYIYAKCSKTTTSGSILLSQSQIKTDDDANYYHFLIGVLHAIVDGVRWISLTFGSTAINGAFIRTGKITSQDGLTWFDLDTGEIAGNITFLPGQLGGSNLVVNSKIEASVNTYGFAYRAVTLVAGKKYTFSGNGRCNGVSTGKFLRLALSNVGYTWAVNLDFTETVDTTKSITFTAPSSGVFDLSAYYFDNTTPRAGTVTLNWYKVEIGSIPTDWCPAASDTITKTIIDGGIITTGRVEVGSGALGSGNAGVNGDVSATPATDIRFWAGSTWANRATAPFRVQNDGKVIASAGQIGGWNLASDAFYTGTKKTDAGYAVDGVTIASNGSIRSKFIEISDSGVKFRCMDSIFQGRLQGEGDLSGTVVNTRANVTGQSDKYRLTITGTSGSLTVECNGAGGMMVYSGSIAATIDAFILEYEGDFESAGVTLVDGGSYIDFVGEIGVTLDPGLTKSGTLTSSITHTQTPIVPVARIDTITLSGTNGYIDITCDNLTKTLWFDFNLPTTAADFVEAYATAYLSGGVIVTSSGNDIIFTASTPGVNFTGPTDYFNISINDRGRIVIDGNEIYEDSQGNSSYGTLVINGRGYKGQCAYKRSLAIKNGIGKDIAWFNGHAAYANGEFDVFAQQIYLENIPTTSAGAAGLRYMYVDASGYLRLKMS